MFPWLVLMSIAQLASGLITIEPRMPVVREGQQVRLSCKANAPIKTCLWEVNKELLKNLENDERFQQYGRWMDGECGIQTNMTELFSGEWICRVLILGVMDRAFKDSTNVTLLVLPQVHLNPDAVTVVADEESRISCIVSNARPAPHVQWRIGDEQFTANTSVDTRKNDDTGLVTINNTLTYTFKASDHRSKISCLTTAPWLQDEEIGEASAHLNVLYPPQPRDTVVLSNLVTGQPADMRISFTANPRPIRVYWELEDGSRVNVEPFPFDSDRRSTTTDRLEAFQLRQTDSNWYEARLVLKPVTAADDGRAFRMTVESDLNGVVHTVYYTAQIAMKRAEVPVALAAPVTRKCPCDGCGQHLMHLRQELEKNRDQLHDLIEQIVTLETLFGGMK